MQLFIKSDQVVRRDIHPPHVLICASLDRMRRRRRILVVLIFLPLCLLVRVIALRQPSRPLLGLHKGKEYRGRLVIPSPLGLLVRAEAVEAVPADVHAVLEAGQVGRDAVVGAGPVALDRQTVPPLDKTPPYLVLGRPVEGLAVLRNGPPEVQARRAVLLAVPVISLGLLPEVVNEPVEEAVVRVVAAVDDKTPVKEACNLHMVATGAHGLALGLEGLEG